MGSPADFVPGAWIQFLRIDGTQLTDPIVDQKSLHAPITEVIPQLDFLLATNGNPPPEFTVSTTNVLAILRKAA